MSVNGSLSEHVLPIRESDREFWPAMTLGAAVLTLVATHRELRMWRGEFGMSQIGDTHSPGSTAQRRASPPNFPFAPLTYGVKILPALLISRSCSDRLIDRRRSLATDERAICVWLAKVKQAVNFKTPGRMGGPFFVGKLHKGTERELA